MSKLTVAASVGLVCAMAALLGCETAPAANPAAATPDVNYEGLRSANARGLDIAELRPGVDFARYTGIMLREPELAFRTPDRAEQQFPLSEEQKTRFRDVLSAAFEKELADLDALKLVAAPGPDVLALAVRVQDIVVSVASRSLARAGRGAAVLEASGDATIVLELKDSQSNEILARGVDTGTVVGVAMRQRGDAMLTNFEEADKVVDKWAAIARAALETLTSDR